MMRDALSEFLGDVVKFRNLIEFICSVTEEPEVQSFADMDIFDFHGGGFSIYVNNQKNINSIFFFGITD